MVSLLRQKQVQIHTHTEPLVFPVADRLLLLLLLLFLFHSRFLLALCLSFLITLFSYSLSSPLSSSLSTTLPMEAYFLMVISLIVMQPVHDCYVKLVIFPSPTPFFIFQLYEKDVSGENKVPTRKYWGIVHLKLVG